ncbi:hypothetical protein GM31_16365, partial [Trabulsiella odontotermitis]
CQQEYTSYQSGRKFTRGLSGAWNNKDGPWFDWKEILNTSVADTRYLQQTGGTMTGPVTFTVNGECIRLKNDAATMSAYFGWYNNDGTRLGYFGRSGAGNGMTWTNQAAGSLINLPADGSVSINTKGNAGNIQLNGAALAQYFRATQRPGAGSFATQYSVPAPFYHEFSDAGPSVYNPLWKQKHVDGNTMWSGGTLISAAEFRIQYINSTGTQVSFRFTPDGQFVPQNYANFDERYIAKGNYITGIRFGAAVDYQERNNTERMAGGVMTSWADFGSSNYHMKLRPLQYQINGGSWVTAAYT